MKNICVAGRAVRDAEIKRTGNGTPYVFFTMAVDRARPKGDEPKAMFFNCFYWRNAEKVGSFIKRGTPLSVSGTFDAYVYRRDGDDASMSMSINVNELTLQGQKNDAQSYVTTHDEVPF